MKYLKFIAVCAMSVSMLSGCVYYNNGGGRPLTNEEKEEVKQAVDEAKDAAKEAGREVSSILEDVKNQLNEEMEKVDWAEELFSDYYPGDQKPLRIIRMKAEDSYSSSKEEKTNSVDIDDVEGFINDIDVDKWEDRETVPAEQEAEYVYLVQQEATTTVLQDNTGRYLEIAKITTYKDSNYVTVTVLDALTDNLAGIMPENWFTSVYEVPSGTADYLRK